MGMHSEISAELMAQRLAKVLRKGAEVCDWRGPDAEILKQFLKRELYPVFLEELGESFSSKLRRETKDVREFFGNESDC